MREATIRTLVVVAVAGLAGCGGNSLAPISETSPEAVAARRIVDDLARGDLNALAEQLDASLRTPDMPEKLRQMAIFFPKEAPTRVRVVGLVDNEVDVVGGVKTRTWTITFESNYRDAHVLSQVVFQRVDAGERRTIGLHANPLPARLEVLNAVTLRGKGPVHFVFVLIMVGVAGVTIVAVVVWVRRWRSIRRRWWWLLGILVGAFKITLNWTTGGIAVKALTFQLLSLGFWIPGPDAPLTLAVSIPAGAIAFLVLQRQERAARADERPPEPPPTL